LLYSLFCGLIIYGMFLVKNVFLVERVRAWTEVIVLFTTQ
jgi:hypothetical protein